MVENISGGKPVSIRKWRWAGNMSRIECKLLQNVGIMPNAMVECPSDYPLRYFQ